MNGHTANRRDWTEREPIPVEGVAPPHDPKAEALVVEASVGLPGFLERVSPPLTHEHFYMGPLRAAFEAIVEVTRERGVADALSVMEWLKPRNAVLPGVTSSLVSRPEWVAHEVTQATSAARIVYELAQERSLALHCQQALAAIYTKTIENRRTFFETFETRSQEIVRSATRSAETIGAKESFERAVRGVHARTEDVGISSGIREYDRIAGLLRPGQLSIIGAPTGNGKTSWGLGVAGAVASRGGGVLYAAVADMQAEELALKLGCSFAEISARKLFDGVASAEDHSKLLFVKSRMDRLPLEFFIGHGRSVQEVETELRRTKSKQGDKGVRTRLLVVDYVQRLTYLSPSRSWNEEHTLYQISEYLKGMATRYDVHVLGLVQTKKAAPTKKGETPPKPTTEDIERCKSIAKPAEIVGFINRFRDDHGKFPPRGRAEMVLDKARWRGASDVPLIFDARYGRFEDDPEATNEGED